AREIIVRAKTRVESFEQSIGIDRKRENRRFALTRLNETVGESFPGRSVHEDARTIIKRLHLMIRHALAKRDIRERLRALTNTPKQFRIYAGCHHHAPGLWQTRRDIEEKVWPLDCPAARNPKQID